MKEKIINSIVKVTKLTKKQVESILEIPPNSELGDYSFPCFIYAKKLKKNPNDIAKDLANKIKIGEKVQANGNYLNFFVNNEKLGEDIIKKILNQKDKYGFSKKGKDIIMIEFSQPNTHKAFHIGHIRGTSFGESLARLLESQGNKVIRVNYSGDTGMHIAKWIWCYMKYHKNEKLSNDESQIAEIYVDAIQKLSKNEEFQEEVDEINRKLDSKNDKRINDLWKKTRELSIKSWDPIYKELNVEFDKHYFESKVEQLGKKISQELKKKGIAKISEGATIIDLKNLGIWVLLRKDGTVLYSAKDLALAEIKFKDFPISRSLVITDISQDLHFKQLKKTLELMKFKHSKIYNHLSYGQVRFPWGKMSSRTGENIIYSKFKKELKDLAMKEIKNREKISNKELDNRSNIISIAAIKYTMLKQTQNKNIIFDKNDALKFEGNTGPYLLYTYARSRSILRKAKYIKRSFKINSLSPQEKSLIMNLSKFPEVLELAYNRLAPNIIANYIYEVAQSFNEFYHSNPVIGSEQESFRLALVDASSKVIKNALFILGIQTLEKM